MNYSNWLRDRKEEALLLDSVQATELVHLTFSRRKSQHDSLGSGGDMGASGGQGPFGFYLLSGSGVNVI